MSVNETLHQIDQLHAMVKENGPIAGAILKKINYKFRLEWNYTSNSMEGNSLTLQETRSVMVGNITVGGKPIKDVLEMKGHDDLISNILKMGKADLNISESRIKEIHKAIVHEDDPSKMQMLGKWKTETNYLFNYKGERFDFTAPADVPEQMHLLINWLNKEKERIDRTDADAMHPVMMALQFHLRYVTIHPFHDGNGRTARVLTNIILIAYGYPPLWITETEKESYYQYLADIQAYGGESDLLYKLMLNTLLRSLQIVRDAMEGKEIEQAGDLDKKLALMKKRLGITHQAITELKYEGALIVDIFNESIAPFANAWEKRLISFDALFENRHVLASTYNGADKDREPIAALLGLYPRFLSGPLKKDERIQFIKLQCNFINLISLNKHIGINGGEIVFNFYENRYEVISTGAEEDPIHKLYGEQLSEDEIAWLVETLGNWAFNNIERTLEDEEKKD